MFNCLIFLVLQEFGSRSILIYFMLCVELLKLLAILQTYLGATDVSIFTGRLTRLQANEMVLWCTESINENV